MVERQPPCDDLSPAVVRWLARMGVNAHNSDQMEDFFAFFRWSIEKFHIAEKEAMERELNRREWRARRWTLFAGAILIVLTTVITAAMNYFQHRGP